MVQLNTVNFCIGNNMMYIGNLETFLKNKLNVLLKKLNEI